MLSVLLIYFLAVPSQNPELPASFTEKEMAILRTTNFQKTPPQHILNQGIGLLEDGQ